MKLLRLQIEKLYGHYNYENIVFNSDVTFIYGLNGCGKTTILNITEAIITGQIYKLFNYDFSKITLAYAPKCNIKEVSRIIIIKDDENIWVTFKNHDYRILNHSNMIKEGRGQENNIEKSRFYFHEYEFLLEIKRIFNYVYLPLNRSSVVYDIEDEESFYLYRHTRNFYVDDMFDEPVNKDLAMVQIERLIRESCNRINNRITHISDTWSYVKI